MTASPGLLRVGAHVDQVDPLAEASDRGADLAQHFLGDPQGWKKPTVAYEGGAQALRSAAESADIALYVHAPYVLNVATTNNRIRIPSRKLLQQQIDLAAEIGAEGLIVHGGHVSKGDDPAAGFDNWRKCVERTDLKVPLLIENTAGGDNAMARHLDRIARLWESVSEAEGDPVGAGRVGFCLDTCHAHASGIELRSVVTRSAPSPAGSISCTPTTAVTPSPPAPTGTPTWVRAGSSRRSWPRSSARRVLRLWSRPPAELRGRARTSPGYGSSCRPPASLAQRECCRAG
jgi:deoxyribonuclease-4